MITTDILYQHYINHPSICTDTRKIMEGDLFFALKGENFDGNQYAAKALASGAAFVVVDDEAVVKSDQYIFVKDVLKSLQNLATFHRTKINIPVLAISGSNGKTTTKELIATVLQQHYRTHFTQGNFNNHIGVPLTLLAMPVATEIVIIEMGANHAGEIADLCKIAQPTHGLLTNVGYAHLEGFGSFDGVKKAKSELYHYLEKNNGTVFINMDEDHLSDLAKSVAQQIKYATVDLDKKNDFDFEIECLATQPNIKVSFVDENNLKQELITHLSGLHNLQNVNTAIAVGLFLQVPGESILKAIQGYQPQNNRSQWLQQEGVYYLLDAYNANPSSMKASLLSFLQHKSEKKLLILGDMFELGPSTVEQHIAIAADAQKMGFENIFLVGELFKTAAKQLNTQHFLNVEELKKNYKPSDWQDARVLIKGSRGMALEKLLLSSSC